ncbi:ABC transporter ATP-binding protein [bacterium]|nr:MAG: ABC transporter ATP-binding protein [bacterium]MCL4230740.1 ABC transporter ATP-binding protein [Dehalococcoidia bacterium]
MLEVKNIRAAYGPVTALHDISLSVPQGQIVTVLGANGAGKSTTLRVISGLLRPSAGTVLFEGRPIHGKPADWIVRQRICHVPEGRQIFATLTVEANLSLGAYTRRDKPGIKADLQRVFDYFPRLAERRNQVAGTLSGGEQQMLAIGRALMARPRLLLLDEPSLGLAPLVVRDIFKIIRTINEEDRVTILLIEQDAKLALSVASYGYVLETGRVVVNEPAADLARNETVRKSYLGY